VHQNKSSTTWSRRAFLRAMGLGGAGSSILLSGCGDTDVINAVDIEVRKEKVLPGVDPVDYSRPGVEMYFATTCRQCPAGCGIHARIREGRVLKLEGNPASPVNEGKLCAMGQAGLQGHYNPDRLTKPMVRKDGRLVSVSWEELMDTLTKRFGRQQSNHIAWLNGAVSGHQKVLIESFLNATGSTDNLFVFDALTPAVGHTVNKDMFGYSPPRYSFKRAELILSFGADFLGTWQSPVHFAREYALFRNAPRGTLIQVEPKMTLTGANADRWMAIRPGSEAMLAMALASIIVNDLDTLPELSNSLVLTLANIDITEATRVTGVDSRKIHKLAQLLLSKSPSLILSGASAEGGENGYETAFAANLLNHILGNIGKTIRPRTVDTFPQLSPRHGSWKELIKFRDSIASKQIDTVITHDTNPVYQAPQFMQLEETLQKSFHVAFSRFPDETTMRADIIIPVHSYLEDWNTSMPAYAAVDDQLNLQQAVMSPVFGNKGSRSMGDILLTLIQRHDENFKRWNDYGEYIREAVWNLRSMVANPPKPKNVGQTEEEVYSQGVLSNGLIQLHTEAATAIEVTVPDTMTMPTTPPEDSEHPYTLLPTARLGLWDGRHANLPWLQELPDQLTEVVWDSWMEIHPKTAGKLRLKTGDVARVSSSQGSLDVKVVVFPGIHPEAVAIPLGQGHKEYGRYAKGRGVNPLQILDPRYDHRTGELAMFATRVSISKIAKRGPIVTLAHGDLVLESSTSTQAGREIVKTVTARQFNRNEEES